MDRLQQLFDRALSAGQQRNRKPAILGKATPGGGTVVLATERGAGFVHARLGTDGTQGSVYAYNVAVPPQKGYPVFLEQYSGLWVVVGPDYSRLPAFLATNSGPSFVVPPHHHREGSGLEYEVQSKLLDPGRVLWKSDLTVRIRPFRYRKSDGTWDTYAGGTLDLTSQVPSTSGHHAWVVVGVDPSDNTAKADAGTSVATTTDLDTEDIDGILDNSYIPLVAIDVHADDTTLHLPSRYYDARGWINTGGGGGALDDLSDVDTSGVSDNDLLAYDADTQTWGPVAASSGGSLALDDLTDVGTSGAADNDALVYDADTSTWGPAAVGGGGSTHSDAYASRPAAGNAGDLFFPLDGFVIERDDGSNWTPWGPLFKFTPPSLDDFTWVNQGTATADEDGGGIFLEAEAKSGTNVNGLFKSAPATPYTITAWFLPRVQGGSVAGCGIGFRQSSDGKLATFNLLYNKFEVLKFNSPTSFVSAYSTINMPSYSPVCFRIADDGTNRICSWSTDGRHFLQMHSIGRTDHLTADQVGFYVNSVSTTYKAAMTLLSWEEA